MGRRSEARKSLEWIPGEGPIAMDQGARMPAEATGAGGCGWVVSRGSPGGRAGGRAWGSGGDGGRGPNRVLATQLQPLVAEQKPCVHSLVFENIFTIWFL